MATANKTLGSIRLSSGVETDTSLNKTFLTRTRHERILDILVLHSARYVKHSLMHKNLAFVPGKDISHATDLECERTWSRLSTLDPPGIFVFSYNKIRSCPSTPISGSTVLINHKQCGAAEARRAHNPEVLRSKRSIAIFLRFFWAALYCLSWGCCTS